jgi:hypothetical protein
VLVPSNSLEAATQIIDNDERKTVVSRVQKLTGMIEPAPKSFGWKMRARIGERTRWYDLPEADGDAMLQ